MPAVSSKSVAQKLMVKDGKSFLLVGAPQGYHETLGTIPGGAKLLTDEQPADIIQVFVESEADLKRELPRLKELVKAGGALWVSFCKGTSKKTTDINRDTIARYAFSIGLEGIAIISVDDDWSALRLKVVD